LLFCSAVLPAIRKIIPSHKFSNDGACEGLFLFVVIKKLMP
jgi:hypothetical protein